MKTKSVLAAAAVATIVAAFPVLAQHDHHDAKDVTVQGEVLDMSCYVAHDGKGPGHAACAAKCMKDGQPVGLLAKDGTVYLLFADHGDTSAFTKTKDLVSKNVEIEGAPADKAGIKGITVKAVKAL
jgi:type 1 fimbria pilin